jgi:hypothetical protein
VKEDAGKKISVLEKNASFLAFIFRYLFKPLAHGSLGLQGFSGYRDVHLFRKLFGDGHLFIRRLDLLL